MTEILKALIAKWRAEADAEAQVGMRGVYPARIFRECADELEAVLTVGDGVSVRDDEAQDT